MSKPNAMLTAAYGYADQGLPVFPLVRLGKIPYGGTNGHKDATTNKAKLLDWWGTTPEANIGLRTGIESGLFVLDVDPRNGGDQSLKRLIGKHSSLPETLTVATGGGGQHFYLLHPGKGFKVTSRPLKDYPGLDVMGDGGYVVAPPSIHETGAVYEFENGHEVALAPDWLIEKVAIGVTERLEDISAVSAVSITSNSDAMTNVDDAIRRTRPTQVGERHICIFDFAREVKSMPGNVGKPATAFKNEFIRFYDSCDDIMNTPGDVIPFDAAYEDFKEAFVKVRHLKGDKPLQDALERAKASPDPPECSKFRSPQAKLLVKICRELQRAAGDNAFFLSSEDARRLLGLSQSMQAYRLFKSLLSGEIIAIARNGNERRATRYRYLIPLDSDAPKKKPKEEE